ncbi:RecX family transcriptional regulator [Sporolactobacillus shoreicorticis]|uniref:Regulatory protein RecX n=1 Tax=Sporolactobacillus shoreicorticis TaxID=1923877 RepID=A0ABW5S4E4_9BACL|nr:RecX family transcriptional regulator [Sporolactobacillus shoreicorticis]MCO7125793.1 RecX family transcriptional regulator [Sporolactobacillus shoreicorticis]
MAIITRIRTNEQDRGFFSVEIAETDGVEKSFTIHEDILVREELRKGLELTPEQLGRLQREASGVLAYHAALRYLSYRMHSVSEMKQYLEKKQFGAQQISYAIQRLKKEKLLDDEVFAASFVRTRIQTSTKGPQLIYRELLQSGVPQEIASHAENLFPLEDQIEHARKYLAKQTSSVKNKKSKAEARLVLARLLMQRGYAREISEEVLSEITEFLEENEKNALAHQAEKAMRKYKKFSGRAFAQKVKNYLYHKGFPLDAIDSFLSERIHGINEE